MKDDISAVPGGDQAPSGDLQTEGPSTQGDEVTAGPIMSRLEKCEQFENWQEVWNPRFSMSMNHTKGLLNAPGQNNCFLNSAVQVFWHLDVFRRSFRLLSGHACMGNSCIFCALKVIFTQFQYSDQTALPPDSLRKALAKSFYEQRRFQQGHMDDAAECFENILTRIHFHVANDEPEDSCKAKHCISHQKFSMHVVEQIVCPCGANTDPLPFTQTVQYVSAKALVSQAKLVAQQQNIDPAQNGFAQLLRFAVSEGDVRNCPSKCGKNVTIRRNLTNAPDVVSIGLIWDTDRPSLQYVNDVLRCIGTQLNLRDLFDCSSTGKQDLVLRLQGVVCYYGKHYSTFFFHSKMKKWTYFDDAHVKELDSQWSSVTDKCLRGHYQPLLLLYGTEDSEPISMESAPKKTTMLPGYQSFSSPEESGYYGNQDYYYPDGKSKRRGHPKYVKYESQYRRSMTPNPESEHQRQGGWEMAAASLRRAITPGPEQMNGHWNGQYDSDEDTQGRQQVNGAHFRQASYLTAMDRVNPGGYDGSQQAPEQRTMDSRKPRMYGGQSQQYVSHSDVQSHYQQQYHHSRPADGASYYGHPHQQQYPYHQYQQQQPGSQSHKQSYEDWTLSNNSQYRRPHGVPSAPVQSVPLNEPVPSNISSNLPPQSANNMRQNTPDPLTKVNEIQRMESFKKGNSKGADVVRYQYANETDSQKLKTITTADTRKTTYKKFGSMADLTADGRPNQGQIPGARPHVVLQRTRSLENALETEGDTRPVTQPASYNRPHSNERPAPHPRPVSAFEPVSAHARSYDVIDGRPPSGKGWQASKDNDSYGTYISRKTVESILSAQGIRAGLKKPAESSKTPDLAKPRQQHDHVDNLSLNSQKDSGYRSGSSGDRNSASSGSSMSAESLVMDPYRSQQQQQQHSHLPQSEGSISAAKSYLPTKHQAEPPLPNKLLPPKAASRGRSHSNVGDEDPYDHLPAHAGRPVHGQPLTLPQKKLAPDMECESLCINAETLMEQSMQKEGSGNLSAALAYCNLAIDELQQGLGVPNCQQQTRMYTKMKLNTCIMRSRSLHRRMLIQQQDPNGEDQTSVSSISTDPETRDYELNHGHYQVQEGSKYPSYQQEAFYMAQYSSDSGYSEYSDSGKAALHSSAGGREGAKNAADIYGTLPKKGSQKARGQSVTAKDAEAYQAYLQRQKSLNKAQTESALSRPSNPSQPPPYSAPQHSHHNQTHPHSQQQQHPAQHPHQPIMHQNERLYQHPQHMYHRQQPSVSNQSQLPENHHQHGVPNQMPPAHPRQVNNRMSKEEIRHLLYTDFVSRGKGGRDQGGQPVENSDQRMQRVLYDELQDKMGHMTVRSQPGLDKVENAGPTKGFAVFPPQMHPYQGKPAPVNVPPNHSRESSASSSHTLQAHSRDNSVTSQHPINAHLQAYMHHQEQNNHQNEDGDYRTQVLPPKPSVIGRLDKMKRPSSDLYPSKNWDNPEQQYDRQFSSDLQTPRIVQKSTSQGALYSYSAGLDADPNHPSPLDVKSTESGMEGQACFKQDQVEGPPPQPGNWEGPNHSHAAAESLEEIGADSSQEPEHVMTVQQPGDAPVAAPTLSTFQRPPAPLVGGERQRSQVGLPGQRTSTTSTTSYESSNNNTSMEQDSNAAASNSDAPKTPKSILKKRSRTKRKDKVPKKSISFSDNIALIADIQEIEPEVDYVAYVSNLQKNSPKTQPRSASLPNLKGEGSKTGYDSDFDDDTSDSASSTEASAEISHCNLCHKRVVESGQLYCPDCSFYMQRLQPQES